MAFSIKSIAPRLFNSSKYETSVARNSNPIGKDLKNPFNSDIKMDVLTADVFGTKTDSATSDSIITKTKRMYSTFVGSINDFGTDFKHAIESVGAFCNRMKNGVVGFWTKLNETEVSIPNIFDTTRSIKAKWDAKNYDKAVQKLAANPVSDLENMLVKEISLNTAA